jgi:23S rRNA (cytosine1962-C5)-methyltransferase
MSTQGCSDLETPFIKLRKRADRRIREGHCWVFSNEIGYPPVAELEPGGLYQLQDVTGEFLGIVYANPSSLITARLLSRKKAVIDRGFVRERILRAAHWRSIVFRDSRYYRLVFSESDGLPGLVIDRYGNHFVCQSFTAGMDRLMDYVVETLAEELSPESVFLRNDSPYRSLEQIPVEKRLCFGTQPGNVVMNSWGLALSVDVVEGQKTGAFLDQEWNRPLVRHYVSPGMEVLDLFCYTAAWSLHALAAGAERATAVDTSRRALLVAETDAYRNSLSDRLECVREPVVDFLKKQTRSWGMIIVDPPSFIKNRSNVKEGVKAYIDVNRRALTKLEDLGILVTCSCSHHLDASTFEEVIRTAARQAGTNVRFLETRSQGPDHPVLAAMPETRYLKVLVVQVIR